MKSLSTFIYLYTLKRKKIIIQLWPSNSPNQVKMNRPAHKCTYTKECSKIIWWNEMKVFECWSFFVSDIDPADFWSGDPVKVDERKIKFPPIYTNSGSIL